MYGTLKDAVLDYITNATLRGIAINPGVKSVIVDDPGKKKPEETTPMSQKAQRIAKIIETGDFGCKSKAVAALMSQVLDEKVTVKKVEDDDDDDQDENYNNGKQWKVPNGALMSVINIPLFDGDNDNDYDPGTLLCRAFSGNDDCYGEQASNQKNSWEGTASQEGNGIMFLENDGTFTYYFDRRIAANRVRFANKDEIARFVSKLSAAAMQGAFGFLLPLIKVSK